MKAPVFTIDYDSCGVNIPKHTELNDWVEQTHGGEGAGNVWVYTYDQDTQIVIAGNDNDVGHSKWLAILISSDGRPRIVHFTFGTDHLNRAMDTLVQQMVGEPVEL